MRSHYSWIATRRSRPEAGRLFGRLANPKHVRLGLSQGYQLAIPCTNVYWYWISTTCTTTTRSLCWVIFGFWTGITISSGNDVIMLGLLMLSMQSWQSTASSRMTKLDLRVLSMLPHTMHPSISNSVTLRNQCFSVQLSSMPPNSLSTTRTIRTNHPRPESSIQPVPVPIPSVLLVCQCFE